MRYRRDYGPQAAVSEPRPALLRAVREFARAAAQCNGVHRIALVGSLATGRCAFVDEVE